MGVGREDSDCRFPKERLVWQAAIGKDEYSAADRQYFPQPGDSDKVLKQKATLRSTVFKSMKAGIGRFADDYLRQMGVGQEGQTQGSVRKYNPVTKRIE